jgi:hypothetical protein
MKKILLLAISFWIYSAGNSQQWVVINSSRGNFSFSFPQSTAPFDSLGLLSYVNTPYNDSVITFQVSFIDSVYISGNDEMQQIILSRTSQPPRPSKPPLCYVDSIETILSTYAQMYQLTTQGTIEGFVTSDYTPCVIRGRELVIRHEELSGDGTYAFAFTRYFYWGQKFLSFTVTGPEARLSELYSYKNALFSSISIY